jgi:hypothetical protein
MTQGDNIVNLNKAFGDDAYYNKGSLYYKNNKNLPYLYEANLPEENFIPKVNGRTKKYTVDNTSVRVSKKPLSITDPGITAYKKDWLQRYKPIEITKPTSSFKSEINWSKWNKEIPENTQLMKEYNAIEQATKENGTWMKNPDGSVFQGTPEQFVQRLKQDLKDIASYKTKGIDFPVSDFNSTNVMGGYNRRFFDNKMEYNDIWDLNLKGLKVDKYFGKPFMSHGQLEYSFDPAEKAINNLLNTYEKKIHTNKSKPVSDFSEWLKDYNNINIKKDLINKPKKFKNGGKVSKWTIID